MGQLKKDNLFYVLAWPAFMVAIVFQLLIIMGCTKKPGAVAALLPNLNLMEFSIGQTSVRFGYFGFCVGIPETADQVCRSLNSAIRPDAAVIASQIQQDIISLGRPGVRTDVNEGLVSFAFLLNRTTFPAIPVGVGLLLVIAMFTFIPYIIMPDNKILKFAPIGLLGVACILSFASALSTSLNVTAIINTINLLPKTVAVTAARGRASLILHWFGLIFNLVATALVGLTVKEVGGGGGGGDDY